MILLIHDISWIIIISIMSIYLVNLNTIFYVILSTFHEIWVISLRRIHLLISLITFIDYSCINHWYIILSWKCFLCQIFAFEVSSIVIYWWIIDFLGQISLLFCSEQPPISIDIDMNLCIMFLLSICHFLLEIYTFALVVSDCLIRRLSFMI